MTIKNTLLAPIILGLIIIMTSITSCKKYPDGPEFTFRSRVERISNTWEVDNYKINGTDFTSLASEYTETFTQKGAYTYSWSLFNGSGTWSFQNKDEEVKLSGSDSHASRTLYILKLEDKSFWYYYIDGDDRHELHLIEK